MEPTYSLASTEAPDLWLVIARMPTGGMHLLFAGSLDDTCALLAALDERHEEVTGGG